MFCGRCGAQVAHGSRFCEECGAQIIGSTLQGAAGQPGTPPGRTPAFPAAGPPRAAVPQHRDQFAGRGVTPVGQVQARAPQGGHAPMGVYPAPQGTRFTQPAQPGIQVGPVSRPRGSNKGIVAGVICGLAVLAVALVLLFYVFEIGGGVTGKYVDTSSGDVLDLKTGGGFTYSSGYLQDYLPMEFSGTYKVDGSNITFSFSEYGFDYLNGTGEIMDGSISIMGRTFTKQ